MSTTTSLITITESAAQKIQEFSEGAPEGSGLQLSVRGGGCSGLMYGMEIQEVPGEKDKVFEENGVRVFIDSKSLLYLAGAKIDYINGLLESGFHITNPNATRTCGCGSSFA